MRGVRLATGFVIMGIAVPLTLFFLLGLNVTQGIAVAATTFLSWCVTEVMASILERPRLQDRSPQQAFREDLGRRAEE